MAVPLVVYAYAKGDKALKERAISYELAYLDGLFFHTENEKERPVWVKFMNEVNNPVPDLALRSRYRQETIEQYEKENSIKDKFNDSNK